jgi:broad specificity phosphatase PhoE
MVQGRGVDASLNDTGRLQAQQFFEAYKDEDFDKIYISELKRTYESVASFIHKGLPFEKHEGLDEISWGSQEGKPYTEETANLYQETLNEWFNGNLDAAVGGGESPRAVQSRQKNAMDLIMSKPEEKSVLICMHGRAMRILLTWLLGKELSEMEQFPHTNLGLYEIEAIGGEYKMIRQNDTRHLNGTESRIH